MAHEPIFVHRYAHPRARMPVNATRYARNELRGGRYIRTRLDLKRPSYAKLEGRSGHLPHPSAHLGAHRSGGW